MTQRRRITSINDGFVTHMVNENSQDNLVEVVSSKASADDSPKVGAALLLTQTILRAEEEANDPSHV